MKIELKCGNIVVLRGSKVGVVIGDSIVGKNDYTKLDNYDSELLVKKDKACSYYGDHMYDIVKVYNVNSWSYGFNEVLDIDYLKDNVVLVWSRE